MWLHETDHILSVGLPTLLFLAIDPSPFSEVQKRHTAQ